jgi:hypothetical protein
VEPGAPPSYRLLLAREALINAADVTTGSPLERAFRIVI